MCFDSGPLDSLGSLTTGPRDHSHGLDSLWASGYACVSGSASALDSSHGLDFSSGPGAERVSGRAGSHEFLFGSAYGESWAS